MKLTTLLVCLMLIISTVSWSQQTAIPSVPDLLEDLQSGQLERQLRARQLLPYHRVAAVPELLGVLDGSSDKEAAATSYYIILEIANQACSPGNDAACALVAELLMSGIDQDMPKPLLAQRLRLLERTVPEGMDVSPLVELFGPDRITNDKLRTTLERINTSQSRQALRTLCQEADRPDFQAAVLYSLAHLADKESLEIAQDALNSPDREVREAGLRLLVASRQLEPILSSQVWANLTRVDTQELDSILMLWPELSTDQAIYLAQSLLNRNQAVLSDAAIAGLAQIPSDQAAAILMEIVQSRNRTETNRMNAAHALRNFGKHELVDEIIELFSISPRNIQIVLLEALVLQNNQDKVIDLFSGELKSATGEYYRQIIRGLAESGAAQAASVLLREFEKSEVEHHAILWTSLVDLVGNMPDTESKSIVAARVYGVLAEHAETADEMKLALEGLTLYPNPETLELVATDKFGDALVTTQLQALLALARHCLTANQPKKTLAAFDELLLRQIKGQELGTLLNEMQAAGLSVNATQMLSPISGWYLAGPVAADDMATTWQETHVDLENPADLNQMLFPEGWRWIETNHPFGFINLFEAIGSAADCYGYAYCKIKVAECVPAQLLLGSDDGVTAWVNGEKVCDVQVNRGITFDSDVALIDLKAGVNTIVLRISQGGGGWNFSCRLVGRDGRPIDFQFVGQQHNDSDTKTNSQGAAK